MATTDPSKLPSRFVYQIGQDLFWVEVWLYNFIASYPPLQIPFFFINQLVIEEVLSDWNVKGYIVLENDYEILERGASAYISDNTGSAGDAPSSFKAPYLFRTDGRNRISIKIFPYKSDQNDVSDFLPPTHWEISHDFIIYDVQDLTTDQPGKKLKTLYFKDEKHQIFSERHVEWSTSMLKKLGAKDSERTMTGNDALKDLINVAALSGSTDKKPLNVGFDSKGTIDKPDVPLNSFDSVKWAAAPSNVDTKIFYTSPSHHCVLDDINYILAHTKAWDGSPVILDYGRWSEDKNWKLVPMSYYFKTSQKNQIERLLINDGMDPSNTSPAIPRADASQSSAIHNFTSGVASIISNYHYSPMVASDDMFISNSPLYNYDFAKSAYNIYFQGNKITDVLTSAAKMAQDGLFNFSQNQGNHILLNVNKTKSSGLLTRNHFTPQTFFLKDYPQLKMIKDLIFLNGAIYFQTPGLTFRTPGKFIFIDRMVSGDRNPFDDRFLGQWMITKVTHFFSKTSYINDVVGTKIDAFSKLWPDTDASY
jgi:hypothetical protein